MPMRTTASTSAGANNKGGTTHSSSSLPRVANIATASSSKKKTTNHTSSSSSHGHAARNKQSTTSSSSSSNHHQHNNKNNGHSSPYQQSKNKAMTTPTKKKAGVIRSPSPSKVQKTYQQSKIMSHANSSNKSHVTPPRQTSKKMVHSSPNTTTSSAPDDEPPLLLDDDHPLNMPSAVERVTENSLLARARQLIEKTEKVHHQNTAVPRTVETSSSPSDSVDGLEAKLNMLSQKQYDQQGRDDDVPDAFVEDEELRTPSPARRDSFHAASSVASSLTNDSHDIPPSMSWNNKTPPRLPTPQRGGPPSMSLVLSPGRPPLANSPVIRPPQHPNKRTISTDSSNAIATYSLPSPSNDSAISNFTFGADSASVMEDETVVEEGGQKQERIQVAIRMRPFQQYEDHKRVWKLLPKSNSVRQTLPNGRSVTEKIKGRNYFVFDKILSEDTTNFEVYNSVAKGIVSNVVSGLNGTIFAYGQTASGKTYTMQGSGSIAEGYVQGGGGIIHMAAHDIFKHIEKAQDRLFLVRVSAMEIYNENVVDLLQPDDGKLMIREDPETGVFVSCHEEIVTDMNSLLYILFQGDKERTVASTNMNHRSSRSHTIFRITIESREKEPVRDDSDSEESDSDAESEKGFAFAKNYSNKPGVLISTLNLVDLAGSESVRNTGATGERQKEGSNINKSLLTLSRVIKSLSSKNAPHINFRDSKLTRILQPHLSGNARIAFVCCATSAERFLEETRSTLAFAARAKLVKTNAQVNEVYNEGCLIRDLQATNVAQNNLISHLEAKAEGALNKLNRIQDFVIETGALFRSGTSQKIKRRHSLSEVSRLVSQENRKALMESLPIYAKDDLTKDHEVDQTLLLRRALSTKADLTRKLEARQMNVSRMMKSNETIYSDSSTLDVIREKDNEIDSLRKKLREANSRLMDAESTIQDLEAEVARKVPQTPNKRRLSIDAKEPYQSPLADAIDQAAAKDPEMAIQSLKKHLNFASEQAETLKEEKERMHMKLKKTRQNNEVLSTRCKNLTQEIDSVKNGVTRALVKMDEICAERDILSSKMENCDSCDDDKRHDYQRRLEELDERLQKTIGDIESLAGATSSMGETSSRVEEIVLLDDEPDSEGLECMITPRNDTAHSRNDFSESRIEMDRLEEEKEALQELNDELQQMVDSSNEEELRLIEEIESARNDAEQSHAAMEELQLKFDEQSNEMEKMQKVIGGLSEAQDVLTELELKLTETATQLEQKNEERENLLKEKSELEQRLVESLEQFEQLSSQKDVLSINKAQTESELIEMSREKKELESGLQSALDEIENMTNEYESLLQEKIRCEKNLKDASTRHQTEISKVVEEKNIMERGFAKLESTLQQHKSEHQTEIKALQKNLKDSQQMLAEANVEKGSLMKEMEGKDQKLMSKRGSLEDLTAELRNSTQNLEAVMKERDEYANEMVHLRADLSKIQAENEELKQEYMLFKQTHEENAKDIAEREVARSASLKRKFLAVKEEREKLSEKIRSLVTIDASARAEVEDLQDRLDKATGSEDASGEEVRLENELISMQNELSIMQESLDRLQDEKRCMLDEHKRLVEEIQVCKELQTTSDSEKSKLLLDNEKLDLTNTDLKNEIEKVRSEIAETDETKQGLSNALTEREKILEEKANAILELESTKSKLETSVDLLQKEKNETITNLEEARNTISGLEESLRQANDEKLKTENERLIIESKFRDVQEDLELKERLWDDEREKLTTECKDLAKKLNDASASFDALVLSNKEELAAQKETEANVNELKSTIEQLNDEIADLKARAEDDQARISDLQEQKKHVEDLLETFKESLDEQAESLVNETSSELASCQRDLEAAIEERVNIQQMHDDLEQVLNATKRELLVAQEDASQNKKNFDTKIAELEKTIDSLQELNDNANESNETINNLNDKIKLTEKELEDMQSSFSSLRKRFDESESSRLALSEECHSLQEKISDMKTALGETQQEADHYKNEKEAMTHSLETINYAAQGFHNNVGQLMSEKQALNAQCDDLRKENQALRKSEMDMQEERDGLVKSNEMLTADLDSINKQFASQSAELRDLRGELERLVVEVGSINENPADESSAVPVRRPTPVAFPPRPDYAQNAYRRNQQDEQNQSSLSPRSDYALKMNLSRMRMRPAFDPNQDSLMSDSSGSLFSSEQGSSDDSERVMGSSSEDSSQQGVRYLGSTSAAAPSRIDLSVERLRAEYAHRSASKPAAMKNSAGNYEPTRTSMRAPSPRQWTNQHSTDGLDKLVKKVEGATAAESNNHHYVPRETQQTHNTRKSKLSWDEGYEALQTYMNGYRK